jgi:2'-5' RNA ligase
MAHCSLLVLMRLFIALDIDDAIRERIVRFVEGVHNYAPDARWANPESLHVTLKFIGEQPDSGVEAIKENLDSVVAPGPQIHFKGYGFFPTLKSARVFWIGMQAGPQLASLASAIDERMASLGIAREERPFSPHLTLARAGGGSGSPRWRTGDRPNSVFQTLRHRLSGLPDPEFGSMSPHEFFLYRSQLSPKGSKYTKLARFSLQTAGT